MEAEAEAVETALNVTASLSLKDTELKRGAEKERKSIPLN